MENSEKDRSRGGYSEKGANEVELRRGARTKRELLGEGTLMRLDRGGTRNGNEMQVSGGVCKCR